MNVKVAMHHMNIPGVGDVTPGTELTDEQLSALEQKALDRLYRMGAICERQPMYAYRQVESSDPNAFRNVDEIPEEPEAVTEDALPEIADDELIV